jgi:ribosomal protein L16 Arg81 hydroxylase
LFLARAWPDTFFVSRGGLDARALPHAITDLERIVSAPGVHTSVFGAKGFRVDAANPQDAITFYLAGHTLYMQTIERALPELDAFSVALARDLDVDPSWITVEGFASPKKGAGTSMHYDFDLNFNVQLVGTKTWRVATNEHIHNPLSSMVVVPGADAWSSFDGTRMPTKMPKDAKTVRMRPGDALFLPRAQWHETKVHAESFAIAFVIKPPPLFRLVVSELTNALKQERAWRAYPIGPHKEETLARALASLPEALRHLRAEDILFGQRWMRWRDGVARELRGAPWRLAIDGISELSVAGVEVAAARWLVGLADVFTPDMCTAAAPASVRALVRRVIEVGAIELVR